MARPGLDRHVKFRRLVRLLGEPEPHVRGYLELMWETAYENGDAVLGDAESVEAAAKYPGEPGKLCAALLACGGAGRAGFIELAATAATDCDGRSVAPPDDPSQMAQHDAYEPQYQVHDLFDHAPEYVAARANREAERRKSKRCQHCGTEFRSPDRRSRYCSENCRKDAWRTGKRDGLRRTTTDTSVNATDADGTPAPAPAHKDPYRRDIRSSADAGAVTDGGYSPAFEEFWEPATNKTGKLAAAKAYTKAVKLIAQRFGGDKARAGVWLLERWRLYNGSPKAQSEYNPHPSTWLREGRYDDDEMRWQETGSSNGNGKPVRQDSPARIRD